MGTIKIDDKQLRQLMRNGDTVSEAARKLGVTTQAVSQRLKALNIAINRNVALRSAHKIVEREINALDQLRKINRYANELLDLFMRWTGEMRRPCGYSNPRSGKSRSAGRGRRKSPSTNSRTRANSL